MELKVQVVDKQFYDDYLVAIAELRMEVFKEYPYCYDGDMDYERQYLSQLATARTPLLAIISDGNRVVGATTAMALKDAAVEFTRPFSAKGEPLEDYFYCAESVLLANYRGRGMYRALINVREQKARETGAKYCVFCGVIRDNNDPRRPDDYQPLDPVWRHYGYEPLEDFIAEVQWREIGDNDESTHQLMFWRKTL